MLIEMFKLRQKSNTRNAKRKKHYKLTELKNIRPLAIRVTFSMKREIKNIHVVVVQRRQRNVQKYLMQVQSCCFAYLSPVV